MNRRPKPGRSRYPTWAPIATPASTARAHTRRMIDGSLAWNPQATLALVTTSSRASSSPRVHCPKPSPRSELRSTGTACPTRGRGAGPRPVAVDHGPVISGDPVLSGDTVVRRLRAAGCVFAEDEGRLLLGGGRPPGRLGGRGGSPAGGRRPPGPSGGAGRPAGGGGAARAPDRLGGVLRAADRGRTRGVRAPPSHRAAGAACRRAGRAGGRRRRPVLRVRRGGRGAGGRRPGAG